MLTVYYTSYIQKDLWNKHNHRFNYVFKFSRTLWKCECIGCARAGRSADADLPANESSRCRRGVVIPLIDLFKVQD